MISMEHMFPKTSGKHVMLVVFLQHDPAIQWAETLGASVWGAVQHVEHIHEKDGVKQTDFSSI